MKRIVQKILKNFAKWFLEKQKPEIIAITGSVGKTTTKKAVSILISTKFQTNKFFESGYNTEIGVPLFILGEQLPARKIYWPVTILKSFFKVFFSPKIDILAVEMGADKSGDIHYLLSFIKPKVSIVTAVSETHLEQFKTVFNIIKEKGEIIEVLPPSGTAILNIDDENIRTLIKKTKAQVITYGFSEEADVRASNIKTSLSGTNFDLILNKKTIPVSVKSVGEHSLYPLLAAAAVGLNYNFSKNEIARVLENFSPVEGRMNIIPGINESYLIDDSYNASPASVLEALKTLKKIAPGRKIAVLGTMNEMGDYFLEAHKKAGREAAESTNTLVAVGDGGRVIASEAKKTGMDSRNIYTSENSAEAGDILRGIIKKGDTVLFKGSQNNIRLEKAVAKVMKEPEKARELLVRQDKFWKGKD